MMLPTKEDKRLVYEVNPWVEYITFNSENKMVYHFKKETPSKVLELFKDIKVKFAGLA